MLIEGKTECLLNLCLQSDATEYISGPAAKSFIDEDLFLRKNVKVTWFDYCEYPEYPQLWSDFVHEVSILDVLFNCGKNAAKQLKYRQQCRCQGEIL